MMFAGLEPVSVVMACNKESSKRNGATVLYMMENTTRFISANLVFSEC